MSARDPSAPLTDRARSTEYALSVQNPAGSPDAVNDTYATAVPCWADDGARCAAHLSMNGTPQENFPHSLFRAELARTLEMMDHATADPFP